MSSSGGPSAMTAGIWQMLKWCAGSWAVGQQSQPLALLSLDKELAKFGWMM